MTERGIGCCLVITMAWSLAAPAWAAETETPAPEAATDWSTVVAQLNQEFQRFPHHPMVRKQLALAHNNYGVGLAEDGKLDAAARELQTAVELDPDRQEFRRNLAGVQLRAAQVAYEQQRVAEARRLVEQLIASAPEDAAAHELLGEIEYHAQRLKEAKRAWQRSLELDPSQKALQVKLDQLNRELPVETTFDRMSQSYFDIRYPGDHDVASLGFDIRDVLLQARRDVGSDFAFWPKRKLVVLFYTPEQFRELKQTPDWVRGLFDGKIRIPLPGQEFDREQIVRIIFHEYTHAVVHEIAGQRCPTWLNEGLAEHSAWRGTDTPPWPWLRKALAAKRLVPWADMAQQFSMSAAAQQAALAYEEAHSIVRYLAGRYGMWRIRKLLKAVAEGASFDQVITKDFHIKPARLEADWLRWLETGY